MGKDIELAILFADVVGSTRLYDVMGDVRARDMVAICVAQIAELKDGGYSSLVDPCPNDLGRSVELMGEVAARTGFNLIFECLRTVPGVHRS